MLIAGLGMALTSYESYSSLYDATYVGSKRCGECHTQIYREWQASPHANMMRAPTPESVVADFDDHEWRPPRMEGEGPAVARMRKEGARYVMELRHPDGERYVEFPVKYVIGYQYRQAYVFQAWDWQTGEPTGVLRRFPLQWSVKRGEFFPYWNMQEKSEPTIPDLWQQMTGATHNSAWNLFCARCHTTNLEIVSEDELHTRGETRWSEESIGCEACHGPGSKHCDYFATNYVNRIAHFAIGSLRGEPVAYIANPPKRSKGGDVSTCARCHGPDIPTINTEIYRRYEPGYSREGKVNDLTPFLKSVPLTPGRRNPTIEVWDDGMPKGIGMLLRSFIESKCWEATPEGEHAPAC